MTMTTVRSRILAFLDLAHCSYRIQGNKVLTQNAELSFAADHLTINREGKPERTMPYQKLNLDKMLFLLNAQAERRP
ncbi:MULTISPECIES: hypothetical protein [Rheinheimera]|uniref:Uncharacterized protein n=1 Tax=Rheinheimera marina TaxID=1774958 RepID=A0ABV9JQS3_9GAMM